MTMGPRSRTPLGGRMNRGFGAGLTFAGFTTSGLAAFAAFVAFSFFGFAALSFLVGIAGASTALAVGVGIAEASGGGGGGAGATLGAVGMTQSAAFGGAAVSQSGGAGVAAGPGTRPRATRRGSTSSVIRSPGGTAACVA